jgi:ATP-dependent DNA helicase DinG
MRGNPVSVLPAGYGRAGRIRSQPGQSSAAGVFSESFDRLSVTDSPLSLAIESAFADDGPLSAAVPGYRLRQQQVEMAQAIASAIAGNERLVVEAGTGTGKTFAYLVPALLSGGKVILSTGTKNLQDQLFTKDLPAVRGALRLPATVALLKGRANYVCHHHLAQAAEDGRFASREEVGEIRRLQRFARESRSGDRGECVDVPESSGIWSRVTSSRDNCLGQECAFVKDCFVLAARRAALAADLIVVNHHLFFADVLLRDEGVAELLPACNTVIFDEAHQLPETARLFFGESVSTTQAVDLARDARNEALANARDCLELPEACRVLDKAARDLRLIVGRDAGRLPRAELVAMPGFAGAVDELRERLTALAAVLATQAERAESLAHCAERTEALIARLGGWREDEDTDWVRWGECFGHALVLHRTPLDVAEIFRRQLEGLPRAWVFTSATLSVQGRFEHYCGELGLSEARTASWASPFDYARQGLLYVPEGMPDPSHADYAEAVVRVAWPLIRASGGRAFVLCTSLRAMRRIHESLSARIADAQLDMPLLLQGEGSKNELLDRFRRLGNAVLVGSQSFWEGVDVRGEALSLVIIDKLPFAPPDDPVLAARIEQLRRAGRNPFMEYQLPHAVISVKQGAGRLIRDEDDRGVLVICDPRLIDKPYGRRIWQSLPPMRRTRREDEAVAFFA